MARATPKGDMTQCIEDCLECYRSCLQTAVRVCNDAASDRAEADHFRLMLNCADICRTAADFMLSKSEFHVRVCGVCADVCETCADSCRNIGDMEDCARICEQCAASCGAMAAHRSPVQLEPLLTHPKAHF